MLQALADLVVIFMTGKQGCFKGGLHNFAEDVGINSTEEMIG